MPTPFIRNLMKSIVDEATAIQFYTSLLNQAPTPFAKSFIEHARDDEKEHLESFTKIYVAQTGHQPTYQIDPIPKLSYKEGLEAALKAELGAQEFYRKIYMQATQPSIKDAFYIAMMDEIEHAIRFSTLISMANR